MAEPTRERGAMLRLLTNPVLMLGIERIVITLTAAFFGYLGYRLFLHGAEMDSARLEGKGFFGEWILSGTAPGLFFVLLGSTVLIVALLRGSAQLRRQLPDGSLELGMNNPRMGIRTACCGC